MRQVPAAIRRELEEHAAAEAPNEACGLIAFRDGVAERFLPGINTSAREDFFTLRPRDPAEWLDLEDEGYEMAVWHSHPTDSARPSARDVQHIGLWEGKPYLILSRPTGELAAWTIQGGEVTSLPLDRSD